MKFPSNALTVAVLISINTAVDLALASPLNFADMDRSSARQTRLPLQIVLSDFPRRVMVCLLGYGIRHVRG
ncbi:hypothetical protein EMCG_07000 [[Emmonsia] crescens]|uniref:Uncharacterized protein n=1 Tax=[Emmonsia] crescens TaxID=73230 RepID=A0A0G2JBE0_9EURO|nr:hypothetical protein EMCG_07000 [Emmonsia crescens UAMH 3008]